MNQINTNYPLLHLQDVFFTYPGSNSPVLKNIDLQLGQDQRIGLIGPNGQGKTTLLFICMGLLTPDRGKVLFKGQSVDKRKKLYNLRQSIGFIFQNPEDQLFSPTVLEDVAFGPLNMGYKPKEAKEIARQVLNLVGLQGFESRITHKLSGGEKRLLAIATVLAMQPEAILLDEPSTGLDPETRDNLITLINNLNQSLLIVSHDWDFLYQTTNQLWAMQDGALNIRDKGDLHKHIHFHPIGHIPHEHENSSKITP